MRHDLCNGAIAPFGKLELVGEGGGGNVRNKIAQRSFATARGRGTVITFPSRLYAAVMGKHNGAYSIRRVWDELVTEKHTQKGSCTRLHMKNGKVIEC